MKITSTAISVLFSMMVAMIFAGCDSGHTGFSDSESSVSPEMPSVGDSVSVQAGPKPAPPAVRKFYSAEEAKEYMRTSPHSERYMKGILPSMADDQLDYCTRLLNNTHDGFIVVDKNRMKVILFDKYGVERRSYGMACAKNYGTKHKKADSRTPEGFFDVEGVYDSTDWLFTDDNGVQSPKKGQFGPRFIRLRTPVSSQIGIHGTCAPWSIGGRSSHGCIRIKNENILELVELVEKGMPVIVTPGRRDMEVNAREGYAVASISTVPGRKALEIPDGPAASAESATEASDSSVTTAPESSATPDSIENKPQQAAPVDPAPESDDSEI